MVSFRPHVKRLTRLLGVLAFCSIANAQGQPPAQARVLFDLMAGDVTPQVAALGSRVRVPGKERVVMQGDFVDAGGGRPQAKATYQLPGLVLLEGFTSGATLKFDGQTASSNTSRAGEVLLETFVLDTPEGMLSSMQLGAAVRLLGRFFGPDPRVTPNYKGPRLDIFELTAPVRTRQDRVLRMKRYLFDSQTGLLISTSYQDRTVSPAVLVETRFLNWRNLEGSAYPGRIERYEAGRLMFAFTIANISAGAPQDPAAYR